MKRIFAVNECDHETIYRIEGLVGNEIVFINEPKHKPKLVASSVSWTHLHDFLRVEITMKEGMPNSDIPMEQPSNWKEIFDPQKDSFPISLNCQQSLVTYLVENFLAATAIGIFLILTAKAISLLFPN